MTRPPPRLRRNLPLLLLQAREAVIARFRPILNAHGLTEQQWRILRALLEHETLEPREIGAICCMSSPSLAGVLARMEQTSLVQRRRLDHDQRRVQVRLAPAGRALVLRMAPAIEAAYAALEAELGAAALDQVYATLDATMAALSPPACDGG